MFGGRDRPPRTAALRLTPRDGGGFAVWPEGAEEMLQACLTDGQPQQKPGENR